MNKIKVKARLKLDYEIDRVSIGIKDLRTPINAAQVAYMLGRSQHIIPDLKQNGKGIPVRFAEDLVDLFTGIQDLVSIMRYLMRLSKPSKLDLIKFWGYWKSAPVKWLNVCNDDLVIYRKVYALKDTDIPLADCGFDTYLAALGDALIHDINELQKGKV